MTQPNMPGTASEVVLVRVFNAPIDRVWQAITTPAAFEKWYFPIPEFRPVVGHEFGFTVEHEGNRWVHLCRVTEVTPPNRLAYTWRYPDHEGDSLVTFELMAEGPQTRLTLRHTGLDSFPKLPAFARENFLAGWTDLIGRALKEFIESSRNTSCAGGDRPASPSLPARRISGRAASIASA
jgi:uncharacterized protein YndB with AHSA1/START domain